MFTHNTFFATGPDDSAPGLTCQYQFWRWILPRAKICPKTFEAFNYFLIAWNKKISMPLVAWVFEKIQTQVLLKACPLPHYIVGAHPSHSSKHIVSEREQSPAVRSRLSTHRQVLLLLGSNVRRSIITVMKWDKISLSYNHVWVHIK